MTSKFDTLPAAANDTHTTFPPFSKTRYTAIVVTELELAKMRSADRDGARFLAGLEAE